MVWIRLPESNRVPSGLRWMLSENNLSIGLPYERKLLLVHSVILGRSLSLWIMVRLKYDIFWSQGLVREGVGRDTMILLTRVPLALAMKFSYSKPTCSALFDFRSFTDVWMIRMSHSSMLSRAFVASRIVGAYTLAPFPPAWLLTSLYVFLYRLSHVGVLLIHPFPFL